MENTDINNSEQEVINNVAEQQVTIPANPESGNITKQKLSNLKNAVEKNLPVKLSPLLLVAVGMLGLFILLMFLTLIIRKPVSVNVAPSPTSSSQIPPSFSPSTKDISNFAKQTEFTDFESQLNTLRQDNEKADYTEPQLAYPLLDMNVNYKNN